MSVTSLLAIAQVLTLVMVMIQMSALSFLRREVDELRKRLEEE